MWQVIGKTYSAETVKVREYLDAKGILYDYIDLDEEPDWMVWFKANRIIAIPAVRVKGHFSVGFDLAAIDQLIAAFQKD
ncbi:MULTISPECIES: hypothetical protein [unclassified Fusibacter]|uniref:glutaredoxin family protein n=1 Tax=unclassified Fusibacter TaxID=2624464 RepID=UPI0010132CD7|nr:MULTISPECIES: hypothetical protein [unclassified Fusibacter]MCK8059292.1 hypothetical protein [Fusibacter sp. A2]NPE21244.1 hypothetical protein [Fusibacter sp. A1]RXV62509.1 hypothetical protein DWB64_05360 [Fusibacter sp. A1]